LIDNRHPGLSRLIPTTRYNMPINTAFLLMAQYNGKAVIPLDDVRRDYFGHMTMMKLCKKLMIGEIDLPVVRTDASQKSWKGVHLVDLASYIDKHRDAALRVANQMVDKNRSSGADQSPRSVTFGATRNF
jgi:hypothetical protein